MHFLTRNDINLKDFIGEIFSDKFKTILLLSISLSPEINKLIKNKNINMIPIIQESFHLTLENKTIATPKIEYYRNPCSNLIANVARPLHPLGLILGSLVLIKCKLFFAEKMYIFWVLTTLLVYSETSKLPMSVPIMPWAIISHNILEVILGIYFYQVQNNKDRMFGKTLVQSLSILYLILHLNTKPNVNLFLINLLAGFTDAFLGYNTFKMYQKKYLTSRMIFSVGILHAYAFITEIGVILRMVNPKYFANKKISIGHNIASSLTSIMSIMYFSKSLMKL